MEKLVLEKGVMGLAVMIIEEGEEIMTSLVGGEIRATGRYKLLAKRKTSGRIEWAHFTERENGIKENVYRGEVRDEQELLLLISIMNRNLKRIFGDHAEMKPGRFEVRSLMGTQVTG